MWGLPKLSTIFLAANYAPQSTKEITQDFKELYSILGEKAPVYKQASPTIRFSYVTPPSIASSKSSKEHNGVGPDWRDEDVMFADNELMNDSRDKNINGDGDRDNSVVSKVAEKYGTEKPIALYLPGLDGFGISAGPWQFNDLSNTFELWRMSIKIEDRSSFGDLVNAVAGFLDELATTTNRPVYVVAESFGGLLAPAVTLRLQNREKRGGAKNPVEGLVLVNPGTSFEESSWDVLAPTLASLGFITQDRPAPFDLPSPYSVLGSLTLSALIPSSSQFDKIVETITTMDGTRDLSKIPETINGMLESFKLTAESLPPGLLEHRVKNWMMVGSSLVQSRLDQLDVPTLVVVGNDDKLIKSKEEADRLTKILPQCEKLSVTSAGHFVLDGDVNLTEAILYSNLDPLNYKETQKPYDPILDWKLPEKEEIDEILENDIKPFNDAFSPIYMSTNGDGVRSMGLDNIPRDGPLLFVSNHQLLGIDLNLLISHFIENDITVRGLAHPIIFQQNNRRGELGGRTPGIINEQRSGNANPTNFAKFGAVMVTPRNYYRVLQSGQNALLFPGGVREVFHGKDEAYQLFWPEKVDFVRTAARFNATIVPISAVGMADSVNMLLEPSEVENLPFLGERAKAFAANVTAARFDTMDVDENFLPPIVAPTLPSRNYFIFGQPMSTSDISPKDKAACENLYQKVQDEMKRGFSDILDAREKDPFKEGAPRLAYERFSGQKAPTFAIEEVNKRKAVSS